MKSKSYIFLFVLIFMIVFSLSAVSADDLQTFSGEVSGDVDVATSNPWNTSGELTYTIPAEAKDIKSADIFVNVYSGSASSTYGANANVSLKTTNGENQIASEELWIENGTSDGTVYPVNDHTDKCYSDYQMSYNITDSLKGLNGSSITIKVDTFKMQNKSFDGRIKLIALVLAYDDGDKDSISYWVDSTQKWTKTNVTTTFDTSGMKSIAVADLTNIALSSSNGNYTLNGESLGDPDNYTKGNTYQYSYWDVSDKIKEESKTELLSANAGYSLKNVLTVLKAMPVVADVSFNTEYTSVPTCYAGTNNTLKIKANANKAGKYLIKLIADGVVVNSTEIELDGESETTQLLTDPTIRPVNDTTVNGADNTKVSYEVTISLNDTIVGAAEKTVPVLYNGNLGYDMEYDVTGFDESEYLFITGDLVIDVKDVDTYLGAKDMNRTDVWTVDLDDDCELINAVVLIPYNWFNAKSYVEDEGMFNVTFNGKTETADLYYRDQGNLGNYGKYGYGLLVYDVSHSLNVSGENTLVLNKNYPTPAVYPSVLVYWYNEMGGTLKQISSTVGADLLSNGNNDAGRIVKSNTQLNMTSIDFVNATLYALAASAQKGESNIIVNGKEFVDVWNGTSSTTDLVTLDITDVLNTTNDVSFVATGSTILALPQFIVVDTGLYCRIDSIKPEYTSVPTAYAGTNNTLTVTLSSTITPNVTVCLLADGVEVDEVNITVKNGTQTVLLTDPTIRPIDETTVNGANNTKVTYTVIVSFSNGYVFDESEITVPVLYNGNLGYDMEYNVTGFEELYTAITGDIVIDVKDVSTYLGASAMNRTDVWTVNLTDDSLIRGAFLFIPYNWFNAKSYNETDDMFDLTFNGIAITPVGFYRDQGNLGNYGKYGYGVLIYEVVNLLNVSGDNTLVLNKKYPTPAVYPSTLVYLYDTKGGHVKEIGIAFGADLLSNGNNVAGRTVKSDTQLYISGSDYVNATLYVLAASAQAGEGNIIVNGKEFVDVWNGTASTTDLFTADISDIMAESINVSFVATGSTILALPQIMVVEYDLCLGIDDIKTEYSSVPTIYAGTNNTLTVTVSTSISGNFTVVLYADDVIVDEINVTLTNGTHKVLLTDPTIRPIDETTVNGANNTQVHYDVGIFYGRLFGFNHITVPVLYNGYLGKDMEYNATFIEDVSSYVINDAIYWDVLEDSTYMALGATNRTDVWNIELNDSYIVKAFVYLAYNWDKSGLEAPAFNVTFNGNVITPKSQYRDQSNLGTSGKYGYGLFIYDVTDLIQLGNNTMVLNKASGLTAVYPSTLVYLTNTTRSTQIIKVYIADGADLLMASSYNAAGRIVKTDSQINVSADGLDSSALLVFAAGAQKGEGSIIVNGKDYVDVWNDTSNSFSQMLIDINDIISDSNSISFVSTGSTILALSQFIFTQYDLPQSEFVNMIVDGNGTISAVLVDNDGKPIANQNIKYSIDGVENVTSTNDKGEFSIFVGSNGVVEIEYAGSPTLAYTNTTITLKDLHTNRLATQFNVTAGTSIPTYAVDFNVGERGANYKFQLTDSEGKPIVNATVYFAYKTTYFNRTTDENGCVNLGISTQMSGEYLCALSYLGDETHNATFVPFSFNIQKKSMSISASAKSYKASAKTKKYTVTLKTQKSVDGKTYLKKGKKVTLKLNGKTYTAKTNDKGQATFSLKITKKGKYTAKVSFEGDNTYNAASKSVKITIK